MIQDRNTLTYGLEHRLSRDQRRLSSDGNLGLGNISNDTIGTGPVDRARLTQ